MQTVVSVGFAPTPQVTSKSAANGDAAKGTSFNQLLEKGYTASRSKGTGKSKSPEQNEKLTEQDSEQDSQEWMVLGMGQLLAAATPRGQGEVVTIDQASKTQMAASVASVESVAPAAGIAEQSGAAVADTALGVAVAEQPSETVPIMGVSAGAAAETLPHPLEPLDEAAQTERIPELDKQMLVPEIASVQADTLYREPAISAPSLPSNKQQPMSQTEEPNTISEDANTVFQKISDALGKAAQQDGNNQAGNSQGEARAGEDTILPKPKNNVVLETNQELTGFNSAIQMISEGTQEVEKANAVDKVLSRFVNDLQQLETGPSEIQLILEPERLGAVTISLSMTESGLSAKIKSADSEICTLIGAQLQHLTDTMRDKGIQVAQVDVVQESFLQQNTQFGQNSYGNSSRQGQAWTGQGTKQETIAPVSLEESLAQTVATYFGGGDSSNGYRV